MQLYECFVDSLQLFIQSPSPDRRAPTQNEGGKKKVSQTPSPGRVPVPRQCPQIFTPRLRRRPVSSCGISEKVWGGGLMTVQDHGAVRRWNQAFLCRYCNLL